MQMMDVHLKAIHAVIDGLTKTDKKGNIVNAVAKSEELSKTV